MSTVLGDKSLMNSQHEGDRSGPQADHDHQRRQHHERRNDVLLVTPFCGAAFEENTIHAGELAFFTATNTLGTATLCLCFLLFSVLVLKLCKKEWSSL